MNILQRNEVKSTNNCLNIHIHTHISAVKHSYLTNDLLEDVANVDRSQTLIYVQIQIKFMCGKWRYKAEFCYTKWK